MEEEKRKMMLKEASLNSVSVAEAATRHQLAKVSFWEKKTMVSAGGTEEIVSYFSKKPVDQSFILLWE